MNNFPAVASALVYILFPGLFLFSVSCNEPSLVGQGVLPSDDQFINQYTDTLTLVTTTVKEDSLRTDELSSNLLGLINDPLFGRSAAAVTFELQLPSNNINLSTNALVLDSAVLSLRLNTYYGDKDEPLSFMVYELDNEPLNKNAQYYSNRQFDLKPGILGSLTNVVEKFDGEDTVLRIRLDSSFGQRLLDQSGTSNFASNAAFTAYMNGLHITSDTSMAVTSGSIYSLALLAAASKLTLYYTDGSTAGEEFDLLIDDGSATINHYSHNFGTAVIQALNNTAPGGNTGLYMQGMASIKTHIELPYFENLGKIVVNKAELVITEIPDSDGSDVFRAASNLFVSRVTEDGANDSNIPDFINESFLYYGGDRRFNSALNTNEYHINLARHFQDIANGTEINRGLNLLIFGGSIDAGRLVAGSSTHPDYAMKLNLTYTKVN